MWEFSINISDRYIHISKKIYLQLKEYCNKYSGIVTTFESCDQISILVSCDMYEQNRLKHYIKGLICDVICEDFKLEYLSQNLNLPNLDEMSKNALMQALLNFDRETDVYIIDKVLQLEKSLDIEAFYYFKLVSLRKKWSELVQIANDNKVYLSSNETLVELLKFLVDNLDVKNDTINLVQKDGNVLFYDINFNLIKSSQINEKELDSTIISSLIALAPKNVNIYSSPIEYTHRYYNTFYKFVNDFLYIFHKKPLLFL